MYRRVNLYSENNVDGKDWLMIIVISLAIILSPIVALFLSIVLYRQKISYTFFIYFAFYFGWFYQPQMDLLTHYHNFLSLKNMTFEEFIQNPRTIHIGKEPYHIFFKYIISLISFSPNVFSSIACGIYAIFFCCFLNTLSYIRTYKLSQLQLIVFLGIIVTVEFYWFLGLRFWSGVFIFAIFAINYFKTKERKYLFLVFLSVLLHSSLFALCSAFILGIAINKWKKIQYFFLLVSIAIRFLGESLIFSIMKIGIFSPFVKSYLRQDSIIKSINNVSVYYKEHGNIVYQNRSNLLFFVVCVLFVFLWKSDKKILDYNRKFRSFIIILFSITNIGYAFNTYYNRFYKIAILMSFVYLFLYLRDNDIYRKRSVFLPLFLLPLILFALVISIVEYRVFFFSTDVWFNSYISCFFN